MASKRDVMLAQTAKLSTVVGNKKAADQELIDKQADLIINGTVFFYAKEEVDVGLKNIDWSGAHIHHQEWPAQLNRFFHLLPLAQKYKQTGDEIYAETARKYIEDWLRYRDGAEADGLHDGDNTLNLSIRLGNSCFPGWGGFLVDFIDSESFDDDFVDEILGSIERQADFLTRNLTVKGNWRISQLDALTITALRFPFLGLSDKFLTTGVRGIHEALLTQMLPDGTHEERSPGYHDWMTRVMVNYYQLKKVFPEQVKCYIDRQIMANAISFCLHANGSGVNDSGIMPFKQERFSNIDQCRELMKKADFEISDDWLPARDAIYPDGGFAFFNTDNESLVFDVSNYYGGHTHLSRLSMTYRAQGRLLVADPGILNYEVSDPFMAYGKSTPAHSTLNINGFNQCDTDALLKCSYSDETVAFAHGHYEGGYWPGKFHWWFVDGRGAGIFGKHDRIVFQVKDDYALVLDIILKEDVGVINNCWQMGLMDGWSMDEKALSWHSQNRDVNLFLKMAVSPDPSTTVKCFEGQEEPEIRGWIGSQGTQHQPAPLVEFSYPTTSDGISAVLLSSFTGSQVPDFRVIDRVSAKNTNYQYLELRTPDGCHDYIAWSPLLSASANQQPLMTDATFAWIRKDETGKPLKGFILKGTYLELAGDVLFEEDEPVTGTIVL